MSKVMTGARATIAVDGATVGIFETCTYSMNFGTEPIHILGRFGPAEISLTSAESATLSCSGFKVVAAGVHKLPKVPKLQDLLTLVGVTITVVDRQTKSTVLTVTGCVPNAYNGNYNARATSRVTISYTGTVMYDEDGSQAEVNPSDLP